MLLYSTQSFDTKKYSYIYIFEYYNFIRSCKLEHAKRRKRKKYFEKKKYGVSSYLTLTNNRDGVLFLYSS